MFLWAISDMALQRHAVEIIKRYAANKKKNLMLPFVKVYCYEVDIEAGFIKCRLPEGLYELYD